MLDGRDIHKYFIDYDSKTENRLLNIQKNYIDQEMKDYFSKRKINFSKKKYFIYSFYR